MLNEILKYELAATAQFRLHTAMTGFVRARRDHIDALVKRAGYPDVTELPPLHVGRTVKAQLENDLAVEQETVPRLTAAIRNCEAIETRAVLEQMLIDVEHHVDWLESQLHLISEIGLSEYLSMQSGA